MNEPLVTVCIPVFNSVKYIEQTIKSVLAQDFSNVEILIQDNASVDGTWELLKLIAGAKPNVAIKRNKKNIGMSANWNAVINRAQGDYVMLLSADDVLDPGFLSSCISAFETEEVYFVSTHFWHLGNTGSVEQRPASILGADAFYQNFTCEVLRANPFQINFTLFKKSIIKKMRRNGNLFSPYITCDYDLFLRLGISGVRMKYIGNPLGYYRIHESNTSNNQKKLQWHGIIVLAKLFLPLIISCPKIYLKTIFFVGKRLLIELLKISLLTKFYNN